MTAATIAEHYTCADCKSPLIATGNGSVCPNGHGRLREKLPPDIRRRNHAIVSLGLRDVRQLPGGNFVFDGEQEQFERVKGTKAITRILDSWPVEVPRGETLALFDGTKIIRLVPASNRNFGA
jgi:hypothetical protein